MPTPTYTPLANLTLGSTATTVTFTSISQSYRDLILVVNGKATAGENPTFRFNADTGSNYPQVNMYGNGSSATSAATNSTWFWLAYGTNFSTDEPSNAIVNIMDYSATDKHKTVLIRDNKSSGSTEAQAGRWASTSAVNSIALKFNYGASWAVGTTFTLYGIAA